MLLRCHDRARWSHGRGEVVGWWSRKHGGPKDAVVGLATMYIPSIREEALVKVDAVGGWGQ